MEQAKDTSHTTRTPKPLIDPALIENRKQAKQAFLDAREKLRALNASLQSAETLLNNADRNLGSAEYALSTAKAAKLAHKQEKLNVLKTKILEDTTKTTELETQTIPALKTELEICEKNKQEHETLLAGLLKDKTEKQTTLNALKAQESALAPELREKATKEKKEEAERSWATWASAWFSPPPPTPLEEAEKQFKASEEKYAVEENTAKQLEAALRKQTEDLEKAKEAMETTKTHLAESQTRQKSLEAKIKQLEAIDDVFETAEIVTVKVAETNEITLSLEPISEEATSQEPTSHSRSDSNEKTEAILIQELDKVISEAERLTPISMPSTPPIMPEPEILPIPGTPLLPTTATPEPTSTSQVAQQPVQTKPPVGWLSPLKVAVKTYLNSTYIDMESPTSDSSSDKEITLP